MSVNSELVVVFKGKDAGLSSTAGNIGNAASRMGTTIKAGVALGVTAFAGLSIAVGAAAVKLSMMGGDAQETASLIETSLGDATEGYTRTLQLFANQANRSFFELQQGSSTIIAMTKSMGASETQAAIYGQTFARMASDLGSFFNRNDAEVFADLQSALSGSSETMQKYGVDVKEGTLKQMALDRGLIQSATETIPSLMRAQLLMTAIQEQANDAMGDAIKTSDSFTNSQRGVMAIIKDTATSIGTKLTPIFTPFIAKFAEIIELAADHFIPIFENDIMPVLADVAVGVMDFINAWQGPGGIYAITELLKNFDSPFFDEIASFLINITTGRDPFLTFLDLVSSLGSIFGLTNLQTTNIRNSLKKFGEWIVEDGIPAVTAFWQDTVVPFGEDMHHIFTVVIPSAWGVFKSGIDWLRTDGTPILSLFTKLIEFGLMPLMLPLKLLWAGLNDGMRGIFDVFVEITVQVFDLIDAFGQLIAMVPGLSGIGGSISGFGTSQGASVQNNSNDTYNLLTTIFTSMVDTAGEAQGNLAFLTGGI